MKRNSIIALGLLVLAAACSKSRFESVPQVSVKSLTPGEVVKGQVITLKARVTDKEGDLQDSLLLVYKRFDQSKTLLTVDTLRTTLSPIDFPNSRDITIQVQFSYGELQQPYYFLNTESSDTYISIGVIVQDRAGHRSNYDESGQILLKKP
ncbi:MAG TPA: hypothetical protein VG870_04025 [Chitinophagaceae bacterium]|nr:hypothetical protein [Chitinophagaceae bacterium]